MPLEPRGRTGAGIALILLLIAAWSVAVVSVAPLLSGTPVAVQLLFYAAAGLAWILPLKPLIRWMHTGRWRG